MSDGDNRGKKVASELNRRINVSISISVELAVVLYLARSPCIWVCHAIPMGLVIRESIVMVARGRFPTSCLLLERHVTGLVCSLEGTAVLSR